MKNLKAFELFVDENNYNIHKDKLKDYKFKVGNYIKWYAKYTHDIYYYKIITINTNDELTPYNICNVENGNKYWSKCDHYELASDYEIDAIKYNL